MTPSFQFGVELFCKQAAGGSPTSSLPAYFSKNLWTDAVTAPLGAATAYGVSQQHGNPWEENAVWGLLGGMAGSRRFQGEIAIPKVNMLKPKSPQEVNLMKSLGLATGIVTTKATLPYFYRGTRSLTGLLAGADASAENVGKATGEASATFSRLNNMLDDLKKKHVVDNFANGAGGIGAAAGDMFKSVGEAAQTMKKYTPHMIAASVAAPAVYYVTKYLMDRKKARQAESGKLPRETED